MREKSVLTLATRTAPNELERNQSDTPVAFNESARLAALHDYRIMDTGREREFDDLALVAALVCGTPMSAINLVGSGRQWFKSEVGLAGVELPFESSICAHAILDDDVFMVRDLRRDARFADNPLVTAKPHVRFYAGAPLRTADGHVIGMVCVLDRTPRELDPAQAEVLRALARQVMSLLELRRRVRQGDHFVREMLLATRNLEREGQSLQRADDAKDEILAMISHELRTPLMIIDGNIRLAERATDEAQRARALEEIGVSSKRMSRLISNMMVLALDGTGITLEREPLLLRMVLSAALAEHARIHPESPVVLEAEAGLPAVVGDATCVDQILTTLLSNAAKYGDPSEPVTLTAVREGQNVLMTVANGGKVIDSENVERLFVPFFRDEEHRRGTPGIGLGLAVCRRLIEAQGGKIWAEALPGGGLKVCFTLAAAEEE